MNFGPLWGLDALSGVGPLSPRPQADVLERAVPEHATKWLRQLGAAGAPLSASGRTPA